MVSFALKGAEGELSEGKNHLLFQGQVNLQITYSNLIVEHLYLTDEETGVLKWGGRVLLKVSE